MTSQTRQFSLPLTNPGPPLLQLSVHSGLSQEIILDAAHKGALWWQRSGRHGALRNPVRVRQLDQRTGVGDKLLLNYNPAVLEQVAPRPVLVSDQGNYSIWDKPRGMYSQGSKWADHCALPRAVELLSEKMTYLVHRLDRAARGLMVVAHTRNALRQLTALFASGDIVKHYHAVVHGNYFADLPQLLNLPVAGKPAPTEVLRVHRAHDRQTTLLELLIKTGRKHQIREHLAGAGFPVVGDRLYDAQRDHQVDLQLSACRLDFVCPFAAVRQTFALADDGLSGEFESAPERGSTTCQPRTPGA